MYSIFIMLLLLHLFRPVFTDCEVGLSLQQSKGSLLPSAIIILMIAFWSSFVGSKSPPGAFDPPTLIYLAVMPGLNEELVYRGILPVCLGRLFPMGWNVASARIGWTIVIPTVMFGLLHGLWLDEHFKLHLEVIWIRNALLSGFIFAWLKERTGSLIMPTIAHGTWDFFLFLPRMI
jgi:membrane protease YdiL (CAAX protease family)